MAMVKNALLLELNQQFKNDFAKAMAAAPLKWNRVAMKVKSTTSSNTYGFLGHFPSMREWIGSRVIDSMKTHGWSITNKLYEATVGVQRVDIEDDNVGVYRPLVEEMGQSAAYLPEKLVFGLLNIGETSLCYDGQNFFDTDHPVFEKVDGTGTSTTQSNVTTGSATTTPSWYVIDDTRAIKALIYQERQAPEFEAKFDASKSDTVFLQDEYLYGSRARGNAGFGLWQLAHKGKQLELTVENLQQVMTTMRNLKADGGRTLNIRPSILVVPPSLEWAAKAIVETAEINGTSNIMYKSLEVVVSTELV